MFGQHLESEMGEEARLRGVSIDAELSEREREVLGFLLGAFRKTYSLPDPTEIEASLGVSYTEELKDLMTGQFQRRGIPYPDHQQNSVGQEILPFIVNETFRQGKSPTISDVQERLKLPEGNVESVLDNLQEMGAVITDGDQISLLPILQGAFMHEIELVDGLKTYGACAIDALGVPFMFGVDAIIRSRTLSGEPVIIEIQDLSIKHNNPETLWVSWNETDPVCGNTHFYESESEFESWLQSNPGQSESLIPLAAAIRVAQRWFENRLRLDFAFPKGGD